MSEAVAAGGLRAQASHFSLLYMRTLRQIPRIPPVLVFGIVMPAIQLLLFGSIFSSISDIPGNPYAGVQYYSYIAPAIMLLTTFFGMANTSAGLIVDLRTGYFDRLRTTPARPWAIFAGRLGADMTRVALQALFVLGLAILLGAHIATGIAGAIVMVLLATFFSASTVALLMTALSLKTKSDQAAQSAFPLLFVVIFLSTAYMPKPLLPSWLQTLVDLNPVEYLIRALRALMLEGWAWQDIGISVLASLVTGALLMGLVLRIYRTTTA